MSLSELGAFLQRHREERGMSLDELEDLTRIRHVYLEAIERGDWAVLPPGVYVRGLLKNYARAIGVSPASVLRMYVKERPNEAKLPEPQLISQPLLNEPRFSIEALLAVAILAVALVLIAWMANAYILPAVREAGGADIPAEIAAGDATGEAPAVAATVSSAPKPSALPTLAPLASSTPKASPSPTPVQGLKLEVKAAGNIWLRIFADEQVVFEGFLREGENDRWEGEAKTSFRLRSGNAGGTEVILNGQPLDALGDRAEVREVEWRLLPSGDIEQSG
jgi:cytoskeletal protein RodZ